MALFTLKRTDYGATLKDPSIPAPGFTLKTTTSDPTFTVGTPATTQDLEAKLRTSGDGTVTLSGA
jgi:hypothetical protein